MAGMECCEHLQVGQKVQDFQAQALLADGSFKDVKLADYKGKWLVVFFYPLDFTFVCPTEIQSFNKLYGEFKKLGAEVIASSTDSVYSHKAWVESALGKVKFPMGSDPTGEMAKMLGVYLYDEGLALRGTFILNPEGEIKSMEVNDNSIGRSAKELLRKLRAAKFVAENDGLVCPASWEPGNDTLKPGEDLIGKI